MFSAIKVTFSLVSCINLVDLEGLMSAWYFIVSTQGWFFLFRSIAVECI